MMRLYWQNFKTFLKALFSAFIFFRFDGQLFARNFYQRKQWEPCVARLAFLFQQQYISQNASSLITRFHSNQSVQDFYKFSQDWRMQEKRPFSQKVDTLVDAWTCVFTLQHPTFHQPRCKCANTKPVFKEYQQQPADPQREKQYSSFAWSRKYNNTIAVSFCVYAFNACLGLHNVFYNQPSKSTKAMMQKLYSKASPVI